MQNKKEMKGKDEKQDSWTHVIDLTAKKLLPVYVSD
jgi:hypothetical protein